MIDGGGLLVGMRGVLIDALVRVARDGAMHLVLHRIDRRISVASQLLALVRLGRDVEHLIERSPVALMRSGAT